jgi:hypothetical protein
MVFTTPVLAILPEFRSSSQFITTEFTASLSASPHGDLERMMVWREWGVAVKKGSEDAIKHSSRTCDVFLLACH